MSADSNNLGVFTSVAAVWAAYPYGGVKGNYVTINGVRYEWNQYKRQWLNAAGAPETTGRAVTEFDGDVIVQNNLTVANKLRVDGELYAKGIKQPNCGWFVTSTALIASCPSPDLGMWAIVGTVVPAEPESETVYNTVYRCTTAGEWSETEETNVVIDADLEGDVTGLHKLAEGPYRLAGYVEPDEEDNYDVGTRLYVRLADGINEFTNFKTKHGSRAVSLKIASYGESIAEIVKVADDFWEYMGRKLQIRDGKLTTTRSNVVGMRGGGLLGTNLGLTSSTPGFTFVVKFRTPDEWSSQSAYLYYSSLMSLFIYSGDHTLRFYSGSSLVASKALMPRKDYTAVVTWDDGTASITIDGTTRTATEKTLSGTEVYTLLGSSRVTGSITPDFPFTGIIYSLKVYQSVVDDNDELASAYSEHEDLLLNLQPQSLLDDAWLDLSHNMNCFAPQGNYTRLSIAMRASEADITPSNLERVNLFNPSAITADHILDAKSGVLHGYIIGSNGKVLEWDVEAHNQYGAVAKVPVTEGKYYCIINPYMPNGYQRVGVMSDSYDYGNPSDHNIVYTGKYTVVQAVYTSTKDITGLTFTLFRANTRCPYPETPLVEVYEMDSPEDALNYLYTRFGESEELSAGVNIDRRLLSSDILGTLGSIYKDKRMLVLGDSITANDAWVNYVANKLKWRGITNLAIGGANITGPYTPPDESTPRHLIYQIRHAATAAAMGNVCYAEGELVDGVYTLKMDAVFISMGYNDASNGRTPGSLTNVKDVAWTTLAPSSDTSAFSTIAAAIKYCLFYLKTNVIEGTYTVGGTTYNTAVDCREAKIIWQTPINTHALFGNLDAEASDARLRGVEDVIVEVCNYYSVPVINGRVCCGITREEEGLYDGGKYLADSVHPNAKGYIKLGEMILGGIISNFG